MHCCPKTYQSRTCVLENAYTSIEREVPVRYKFVLDIAVLITFLIKLPALFSKSGGQVCDGLGLLPFANKCTEMPMSCCLRQSRHRSRFHSCAGYLLLLHSSFEPAYYDVQAGTYLSLSEAMCFSCPNRDSRRHSNRHYQHGMSCVGTSSKMKMKVTWTGSEIAFLHWTVIETYSPMRHVSFQRP